MYGIGSCLNRCIMVNVFFGGCILLATASHAQERESVLSLADLGYVQGLQQQATDGNLTFYVPLPQDVELRDPRLVLRYSSSPLLNRYSSMQIRLNGIPRHAVSLGGEKGPGNLPERELVVPLNNEDLRKSYLEVQVRSTLLTAEDRCVDERANRGFLTLLPQSALRYEVNDASVHSIRGYLSVLPKQVSIAVAQPAANTAQLQAAWLIARELESRGHQVRYTAFSEGGDIFVGQRAQLQAEGFTLPADAELSLSPQDKYGPLRLLVADPFSVGGVADSWGKLLADDHYPGSSVGISTAYNGARIPLSRLGLVDAGQRLIGDEADWYLNIGNHPLLKTRVPAALHLNLIVPPVPQNSPLILYVFQDNVLRSVNSLPSQGGAQSIVAQLMESETAPTGTIRILLKRQTDTGDCRSLKDEGYVQVLGSSVLETVPAQKPAETFAELGRWLSAGSPVYLPGDALTHPQAWGEILTALSRDLDLDAKTAKLLVGKDAPDDARTFLWLSPQPPAGFKTPLDFQRGRFQVKDYKDTVLLDSGALPGISVAALLRDGDRRGFWLRAVADGLPLSSRGIGTSSGDIAFADRSGVVLTVDSRENDLSRVDYPDYSPWYERLSAWKGWIFAFAWVLLTVLVLRVVRRMRQARGND